MPNLFNQLKDSKNTLSSYDYSEILVEVDDKKRKQLQEAILEMYKDVLLVCKAQGITPYLVGGSALGAIRHKGFIPWDDDLDIGMTREDHSKFIKAFNNNLSDQYILNAPNYSKRAKTRFTKIYKKGTVCKEIFDDDESLNGIFLDIFIIDNVPSNKFYRKIKGTYCNFLEFISSQVYFRENINPIVKEMYSRSGKANYYMRKVIGTVFSFRSSSKWFDSVDKNCRYKKTDWYGLCTGRKHYLGEIFEKDVLFPARHVEFCDIEAPVFNRVEEYLANLYGDYMKIPPENERERHYLRELRF